MKKISLDLTSNKLFSNTLNTQKEIQEKIKESKVIKSNIPKEGIITFIYNENDIETSTSLFELITEYIVDKAIDKAIDKFLDFEDEIVEAILSNDYYYGLILAEVLRYFYFNELLKEETFLNFNLNGFDKEVSNIYEKIKYQYKQKEYIENMRNNLVKYNKDINVENYETLTVDYEDNMIYLLNNTGDIISPSNIKEKFHIMLNYGTQDGLIFDVSFCAIVCICFKVKTLYIPFEYKDVYNELIQLPELIDITIELKEIT